MKPHGSGGRVRPCLAIAGLAALAGCARDDPGLERQKVLIEIDRMSGTDAIPVERRIGSQRVSLARIYEPAGLDLRIVEDQSDIPRRALVPTAELHRLLSTYQSVEPADDEWKVYVLVATEELGYPESKGLMFDDGIHDENGVPREAFAVFQTVHERVTDDVPTDMLRTVAHELAHAFNLHHEDWEGESFERASTLEGYSEIETVLWRLSAGSVAHLTDDDRQLVRPGSDGLPFGVITQAHRDRHRGGVAGPYEVVDPAGLGVLGRRTDLGRSPLLRTAPSRGRARPGTHPLRLVLHAPPAVVIGEPITVTVELRNVGDGTLAVNPLLAPEYGFLNVGIRRPGAEVFRPYRPPLLREASAATRDTLGPGEALAAEAKVFYGPYGWTFDQPGEYLLVAEFPDVEDAAGLIRSDTLTIRVAPPGTEDDSRAFALLQEEDGATPSSFGTEVGLFLYLEGGEHLAGAESRLRQIIAEAPLAAQAPSARLAIGRTFLEPGADSILGPGVATDSALVFLEGLEFEELPPLTFRRAWMDLIAQLETENRDPEARRIRDRLTQNLETVEIIQGVDTTKIGRGGG